MDNTFQIKSKDGLARTGMLQTRRGSLETPFFMPVATKAAVKYLSSEDLVSLGAKAVISNSFILSLRPGAEVIQGFGGLGSFMQFPGVNVTDSGGFQMYQKKFWVKTTEQGIIFRNPFAGEKILVTPEKSVEIQFKLGADIAMCLDHMPVLENSREEIEEAVRKTTAWARRCRKYHDQLHQGFLGKRQLLFGIAQGGIYADLRERSVRELLAIDFDGYSIGGVGLGGSKEG